MDPNVLQTIGHAMAAEFEFDIYVELCRGINATSQINLVHSKISSFYPIYFVWM